MADQDWIGLMIFKNFADQDWIGFNFIGSGVDSDWKVSQSAQLCKYSAPSPLMYRQKANCLLHLNYDCHAIISRASLWSAIAIGTKEYTWPTNLRIIFMCFLEYCLKDVLFRYLVNPMQNQTRSTKWHSAINRSISAFKATFFWLEFWNST